ncbi:MAG: DUF6577 family protein [Bellilinea sp.]|jgi:hypothetical protein
MARQRALERKLHVLKEALGAKAWFKVADAQDVLGIPKSTLYWDLFNMVESGSVRRIGKGVFTFRQDNAYNAPLITGFTERVNSLLVETGVSYYFTGIDGLLKYMHHIPEAYPVILCVEKHSKSEIEDILLREGIHVLTKENIPNQALVYNLSRLGDVVLLYETRSFRYVDNGFAVCEKAFVDLFYEVTRRQYPLALQEVARVYADMKRAGALDAERMIRIARERSIEHDIRLLLSVNRIHPAAISLANMIKEGPA